MTEATARARHEYLGKCAIQKNGLLKQEIVNPESEFRGLVMTKRDIRELNKKQVLLRVAQKIMSNDDGFDGYMIPEDKNKNPDTLYKQYEERKQLPNKFLPDQDRYDANQTQNDTTRFWAKDCQASVEYYVYVLDESATIAFLIDTGSQIGGPLSAKGTAFMAQIDAPERQAELIAVVQASRTVLGQTNHLLKAVAAYPVLIVVGESASAQTTKLPDSLPEASYTKDDRKIGCMQPQHVAAMSVTGRVADKMGISIGNAFGYAIWFEDCTSPSTVIKYMTNKTILRETKPVSVHHQNDLNDDATIVPPLDVMVRTKPKIEHHEDNNNPTNNKRKLTRSP
ncbi:hypothetical protein O181_104263 [Austropuccinia psidii MF-1]|uniref:Uncharacterized protein n=1 Tax=Austropuccinia psidii MF-1 TaxID=1389203 RepID=A0A9Q3JJT4_9BASI|nr:hypothetical protein [Austropuccinia psidii MF-1]